MTAVNLHRTTVVTKQVSSSGGSAVVIQEPHDWSSSLLSCCEDCRIYRVMLTLMMTLENGSKPIPSVNASINAGADARSEQALTWKGLSSGACGFFCYPCLMCRISRRLGEHCCVPMCVPGGGVVLRTKLRLMLGIQGTVCNDCFVFCCCCCQCAACQMEREMDTAGWPQT